MMPTKPCTMGLMLAFVSAAVTLHAEVRLETRSGDAPEVAVIVTPSGPWSPTSAVTPVVLNPDGDLIGDTPPGWNSRGAKALAAWARPVQGSIELSIGQDDHWTGLAGLVAPDTHRQPMVDALAASWTVTWQQDERGRSSVWAASVSDDGVVGDPVFVGYGLLVGTVSTPSALHVLIQHSDTGTLERVEVIVQYMPTQPIPIELRPGAGIMVGDAGLRSLMGSCALCAELRLREVQRDGNPTTVLTWWTNASTLNAIEIGERGPVFPVLVLTSRSSAVHPPKLIDDALRQVLRR